jgi:hypothetical protein
MIPATADTTLKAIKTATIMRNLTERAERMAQQGKIRGGTAMVSILMILILVASVASAWISYSVLKILGG